MGEVDLELKHELAKYGWKVAFFNAVDAFRRGDLAFDEDPRIEDEKLEALFAAIVCTLYDEKGLKPPRWATPMRFLPEPWFVSGSPSLYAMALRDSPIWFRRNNIFVLDNFLDRC